MPVESWFATAVFFEDLAIPENAHELAMKAIWHAIGPEKVDRPIRYTAFNTDNTLHLDPRMAPLFEQLHPPIRRFLFDELKLDAGGTQYYVGRCWPVIQTVGGAGGTHRHAGAVVSGVFYLEIPPGSGGIEFHNPGATSFDQVAKQQLGPWTFETTSYPAVRHRVMLFGSHIEHRALPNAPETEGPRVAIGFDVYSLADIRVPYGMPHANNLKPIA